MLVYNDENVDTIDCENDIDSIKCTLREWWNVTDRESTLDIVQWLLEEGHHAEADRHWQKFANADWKTYRQRNTVMGMTRWKMFV